MVNGFSCQFHDVYEIRLETGNQGITLTNGLAGKNYKFSMFDISNLLTERFSHKNDIFEVHHPLSIFIY